MAVSRCPASSSEHQFWRKQTLKLDASAAITDPKEPFEKRGDSGLDTHVYCYPIAMDFGKRVIYSSL